MATILASSIILHLKLPKLPQDNTAEEKTFVKCAIPAIVLMTLMLILIGLVASEEQFGLFLLMSVIQAGIQNMYPLLFLLNHPNLKVYAIKTLKEWFTSKFVLNQVQPVNRVSPA